MSLLRPGVIKQHQTNPQMCHSVLREGLGEGFKDVISPEMQV